MKNTLTTIEQKLPTQAQITARAYQIFMEHGSQPGHEIDDWLQAEYELMQLPVHKIAELGPAPASKRTNYALVALVQAAMTIGAAGWQLQR